MKILSIETSCDETAIAIVKFKKNGDFKILSNKIASQIQIHKPYGGVVPNLARRAHQKNLIPLLKQALKKGNFKKIKNKIEIKNYKKKNLNFILNREPELLKRFLQFLKSFKNIKLDIDLIGVTVGPGLEPALWTGINFARALSFCFNIPIVEINHIEGHIASNFIKIIKKENLKNKKENYKNLFPSICLVISGGHTMLILMKNFCKYKILGETLDDAAGEAFDKAAKILNLGYPGGPVIEKLAKKAKNKKLYKFTPPMWKHPSNNFSFSGLKTALINLKNKTKKIKINEMCYSFQHALFLSIYDRIILAHKKEKIHRLVLSGGVAANRTLIEFLKQKLKDKNIKVFAPKIEYCTDNGAMVALRTYLLIKNNVLPADLSLNSFNAIEKFTIKKQKNKNM